MKNEESMNVKRDARSAKADRFFKRELSWLAFNRRVLEEAQRIATPLCERAKFLAIVSSNLDEFVMVRYAELRAIARGEISAHHYLGDPKDDCLEVLRRMRTLVNDQYACWNADVAIKVAAAGAVLVPPERWDDADRETLRRLYIDKLEPVLTPLAVDNARPFPVLANRAIHVAVQLIPVVGGSPRNALVSVPGGSRLIALVSQSGRWALAEDVVMTYLDGLFTGYTITSRCLFRVTRDGTLDIDEEQSEDLLSEIEQELSSRERGQPVRLEVGEGADKALVDWLTRRMGLDAEEVMAVPGSLDLTWLFGLGDAITGAQHRDVPLPAVAYPPAEEWADPFARIKAEEFLLHHPYQSFQPVVDLVQAAAADPRVLAIKQTLYRVSGDSPIVKALIEAARSGKQVTVLIELKARFDEATNIKWAKRLEEAGAHVIYGLLGYKVHAKLLMIIRRDVDGIRRYIQVGTGNYNDRTARMYTDLSYFTSNEAVGRDVSALFNMLSGYSQPPQWERLEVAPLTMRPAFTRWIRREAELAKAGKGGRIIAKFNSLVDQDMCEELYSASQAGVEIDLIVRGMCILRPGVPGLSPTIRVRSLVGRFLEHHRIYYFANRESSTSRPVVAIASADWMSRNLDRRVECLTRIEDPALQTRLIGLLDIGLADNTNARILDQDGVYHLQQPPRGSEQRSSVADWMAESVAAAGRSPGKKPALPFRPAKRS